MLIRDDECWNVSLPYVKWIIDSTDSCNVTPKKEFFTSYKVKTLGKRRWKITIINNYVDIRRMSDICVEINSEYTLFLKNVGHVSNIRLNMVSTHILYKEVYDSLVFLLEWDHLCFSPTGNCPRKASCFGFGWC